MDKRTDFSGFRTQPKAIRRNFKRFCLRKIFSDMAEGYRLLWMLCVGSTLGALKKTTPRTTKVVDASMGCARVDLSSSDEVIGLSYGFSILAKLLASVTLWIPSFIMDTRPGFYASTSFAIVGYIGCLFSMSAALLVTGYIIEPLFKASINKFTDMFSDILTIGILTGATGYMILACLSMLWIIQHRYFLHEFILQQCSKFRVAKNFQRSQVTKIFAITVLTIALGDPLLVVTLTYSNLTQGKGYLDGMSSIAFGLIKATILMVFAWGAFVLYMLTHLIPIMSNFLIVIISKHVKTILERQLGRRKGTQPNKRLHNPDLLALVDSFEQKIIDDLGCDTLTMDWPDVAQTDTHAVDSSYLSSGASSSTPLSCSSRTMTLEKCLVRRVSRAHATTDLVIRNNRALATSGLLFTYKNLVKLLSELKSLIRSYEQKFGGFHLAQIYLSGFVTAQWIVSGLAEARSTRADHMRRHNTEPHWTAYTTLLVVRAVISLSLFVFTNTITFLRADRLPQQLMKLRSRLFKINLELARDTMAVQRVERTQQVGVVEQSMSRGFMVGLSETNRHGTSCSEWPEIEQAWCLYDQVVRMSHRVNFRLGSNLYYNKNCLLKLIGREISLILLYVQLIDIYSNSVW